ncbi:MAG: hypothetical protein JWM25_254 [Thermoleophilia bacterium]|nr:hypothetical protein [Thermoleophilia bacterium]MCZ4495671.1 hypothetical protein [Thermoleophilia bacterium]
MATPDIGTTISEGYSRGFERVGPIVSASIVPLVVAGVIALGASIVQGGIIDTDDVTVSLSAFAAIDFDGVSKGEMALYQLIGIVSTLATFLIGTGLSAMVAGRLHRERHGAALDLPSPGASMTATIDHVKLLTPKVWLLAGLQVAGAVGSIVHTALGALLGFAAGIYFIYLSIRWIYATVIAGSGEATHDAAYARSEEAVTGSWWGTLGVWIVIGLAIGLPIVIVSVIIGAILGSISAPLGVFAALVVLLLGVQVLFATAIESAWHQVETKLAGGHPGLEPGSDAAAGAPSYAPPAAPGGTPPPSYQPPAVPPTIPPATPPTTNGDDTPPHQGPFV